ncbi:MAG: hypothetical protein K6E95_00790 [Lachnospiraceae bacterium]|nr:hypothetical protein [Lachnospiraceae bacterium]
MFKDRKKLMIIIKTAILLGIAVVAFFAGKRVGAATAQPGSQSDPLVTLSYLEKRLKDGGISQGNGESASFEAVTLVKGSKLTLSNGSEAVVIEGNGTVFGGDLINLTGGEAFKEGTNVVLYSDYLAAGSGRGIKALGKMKIYVKGVYSLE